MDSVAAFARLPATALVLEAVRAGAHRQAGGLWGASAGLLLATLARALARPLLIVTADDEDAETLAQDLATFGIAAPIVLPEQTFDVDRVPDPTLLGRRTRALVATAAAPRGVVLASWSALAQDAPAPRALAKGRVRLARGEPADREA